MPKATQSKHVGRGPTARPAAPLPARGRRTTWLVAAVLAAVGVLVTVVVLVVTGGSSSPAATISVDFTPPPGSAVPPDSVRTELVAAIDQLVATPAVRIDSVGYTEGRRSDVQALVDVVAKSASVRELIGEGVAVGGPLPKSPTRSEYVLVGKVAYIRVLQPGQDPQTPFQLTDASEMIDHYLLGSYTQLGRIFDALPQLARLLGEKPYHAERLQARSLDGAPLHGVRVTFDAHDVAVFLHDDRLEQVDPTGITGSTVFELWYGATGLRELVATGTQFQDGEALDSSVRLTYRAQKSAAISAPTNTVAL